MTKPSPGPRVVVIANAPMMTSGPFQDPSTPGALSRFIDGSEIVVRMNDIKNVGVPGLGRRTDILAITNTGGPGSRYATRTILDHPIIVDTPEIWFGSAPELIDSGEVEQITTSSSGWDWAPKITAFQRWEQRKWRYIPAEVTRDLTTTLRALGSQSIDPSLGARVVAQVLADPRFHDHAIHLLGFGFRGVDAHDFDAERLWINELAEAGRIAHAPGSSLGPWFPHRGAANTMRFIWKTTHRKAYRRLRGRTAKRRPDEISPAG